MLSAPIYKEDEMPEPVLRPVHFKLDMDELDGVLKTQSKFTVSSKIGGKDFTVIEATRFQNPGDLVADNQVNVLC